MQIYIRNVLLWRFITGKANLFSVMVLNYDTCRMQQHEVYAHVFLFLSLYPSLTFHRPSYFKKIDAFKSDYTDTKK